MHDPQDQHDPIIVEHVEHDADVADAESVE